LRDIRACAGSSHTSYMRIAGQCNCKHRVSGSFFEIVSETNRAFLYSSCYLWAMPSVKRVNLQPICSYKECSSHLSDTDVLHLHHTPYHMTLYSSQAKPSQAKPSQAKPSQAKPPEYGVNFLYKKIHIYPSLKIRFTRPGQSWCLGSGEERTGCADM
jgi:hypothetical protein